ncbi:intermembrane transport protein PqiB [Hasllibacter sp. MH4015]|uniref:PqiB family protein n=1 Tax=Hasllibacter sp. MH4015 TaxID=2854029 RepID=UPI001CD1ABD0|nr:MlaD family protein [Hasllibacter sp. MH4015]
MADNDIPELEVSANEGRRISWVWVMPLLALAISVFVVVQTYRGQGPIIIVTLPSASGIEAGETPLRFRDVQVGLVEELEFSEGFGAVEAHIRLDSTVAPYVDADAEFWLVQPEVSARGITGLSTVLSGVYIEGTWDGEIGFARDRFEALEDTPLFLPGEAGTQIVLRSRDGGQLAAGAPVLYNGIEVGRLGVPELSENGTVITMDAFIEAPHDARLSTNTRFWDISGISVDLNTSGLSINFESLASLVEGGVAFEDLVTGGEPIEEGHLFEVYGSRSAAQRSVFEAPVNQTLELAVLLPADGVRLALGATVRYGGVRVGEVTNIIGFTDPRAPDDGVQILVSFTISPARIGMPDDIATIEELLDVLGRRVRNGLRVRVASEGLLGTSLILEMFEDEDPDGEQLVTDLVEAPLMPGAPANVTEAAADIDAIVSRVAALPIEDLMNAAIDTLNGITALSTGEDIRALPVNLNALVEEARTLVAAEEIQTTLADVASAAAALEELVAGISDSEGVSTALTALESSDTIVANLQTFTEGLPDVLTSVEELVAQLDAAPVTSAASSADRVLRRIETILAAEGAEGLPDSLNASLTELAAVLSALREGGAAENLSGTLASADSAFSAFESAAEQVPAIVTRLNALVGSLQGLSNDYDDNSTVYRDLRAAISDISQAADAFRSLARAIERNPNSLITGR